MSDAAIADTIESYQQEAPEKFVPGRPYSDLLLLRYDSHRVVFEDLTRRIRWGKNRYGSALEGLAQISRGSFSPQRMTEEWLGPEGPVVLEFFHEGRPYRIQAQMDDHRFDMMVLVQLNLALFGSPYRFEVIDPLTGSVFITALTAEERALIERERRLPFYVLDLARMMAPLGRFGSGRRVALPQAVVKFVGTLNEFADRSLGKLEMSLEQSAVTGTFRYYGEDHSERFEFQGRLSPEEGLLGGSFRGSIRVAGEERYHPYLGDWVGQLSPGNRVAYGTWRGWLADDGDEKGPEDESLVYIGQWGMLEEELLNSEDPYLRRVKRWLQQVWQARNPTDYPITVSPGLRV